MCLHALFYRSLFILYFVFYLYFVYLLLPTWRIKPDKWNLINQYDDDDESVIY